MRKRRSDWPGGWESVTIGDVVVPKVQQGTPNTAFIYIDIGSVNNKTKQIESAKEFAEGSKSPSRAQQHVRPGDILVSMTRPNLNAVAKVPTELDGAICSTGFEVLRPIEVEPDWLFLVVKSRLFIEEMASLVQGALYPAVRPADIRAYNFALPPLAEQRRIVAKIEALQKRSRRAREALAEVMLLLEQFRQSVLAAAFRGDLTADWRAVHPSVEPASELLHRIRTERRRRWEQAELANYEVHGQKPPKNWRDRYKEPEPVDDSALPELPEGWCWARWNEVGFCQNGRAFPSENYAPTGVKLLRPGNLHVSGAIVWTTDNTRYMPIEWEDQHPRYVVRANELIMNLTAQSLKDEFLGRVCLTGDDERCLLNQRLARITPVLLSSDFCLILFKSPVFRRYVDTLNTGSLIQHMFTSQVDEFVLPLPPHDEQLVLIATVKRSLQGKDSVEALVTNSCKELDNLDQSILAKAFRGELVPQDPSDESASVLLERIHTRRKQRTEATKQTSKIQRRNQMRKKSSRLASQQRPLVEVLITKGHPMLLEQLLTESGYDDDTIEDFYSALREEIAKGRIREHSSTESDVMLEAIKQ